MEWKIPPLKAPQRARYVILFVSIFQCLAAYDLNSQATYDIFVLLNHKHIAVYGLHSQASYNVSDYYQDAAKLYMVCILRPLTTRKPGHTRTTCCIWSAFSGLLQHDRHKGLIKNVKEPFDE